jgi:hypothetical protein
MSVAFKKIFPCSVIFFLFTACLEENSPRQDSILALIPNSNILNDSNDYETWTGCTISILKNNQALGYFCIKENYKNCTKSSFIDVETENIKNSIVSNLDIHDLNFPICSTSIDLVRNKILGLNPPDSFYSKEAISDFTANLGSVSLWQDCSKVGNQTKSFISIMDRSHRINVHNWRMLLALHGNPTSTCINTIGLTAEELNYYENIKQGKLNYGIKYNAIY